MKPTKSHWWSRGISWKIPRYDDDGIIATHYLSPITKVKMYLTDLLSISHFKLLEAINFLSCFVSSQNIKMTYSQIRLAMDTFLF